MKSSLIQTDKVQKGSLQRDLKLHIIVSQQALLQRYAYSTQYLEPIFFARFVDFAKHRLISSCTPKVFN